MGRTRSTFGHDQLDQILVETGQILVDIDIDMVLVRIDVSKFISVETDSPKNISKFWLGLTQ